MPKQRAIIVQLKRYTQFTKHSCILHINELDCMIMINEFKYISVFMIIYSWLTFMISL
jgi:hypothetical protein